MLLQIKSRMLLPKQEPEEGDEEDPRELLVQMLVEYRRIKEVARLMADRKRQAARQHTRKPFFADSTLRRQVAVVERQEFDVGAKMEEIVTLLGKYPEGIEFEKAFVKTGSVSEMVASFLAVLELLKLKVVRISQSQAFAPIYLFMHTGGEPDAAGS